MSDYINGALQRSIDIIEEVESVIDDFLRKFEPWQVAVASVCGTVAVMRIRQIIRRSNRPVARRMRDSVLSLVMLLPSIRRMIDKELVAASAKLTDQIHRCDSKRVFLKELPKSGMTDTNILALADEYSSMGDGRSVISSGHVSGAVYSDCDDKSLTSVQSEIFKMFGYSNPLHPMLFPDCRKMEAEVVRMVANMFNGDEQVRGTMTSGGTESILLAMLAYRNRANNKGISEPQMVISITAHAAFEKAAIMFGIRLCHVPVGSNGRVDVKRMERAITRDTCVLVASAPNFPTGTVDDVAAVSQGSVPLPD